MRIAFLLAVCFVLNAHAQLFHTQSGAFIDKSRISSAPDYLFSDDSAYWFTYRDGRRTFCLLALRKDMSESKRILFDYDPERESVLAAGKDKQRLWHDRWKDDRMRIYLLRYLTDFNGKHIRIDTLFKWHRHFPMQKLKRHIRYQGADVTVQVIPELNAFNHRSKMYSVNWKGGQKTYDTITLLEEKAELYEFLYAEELQSGKLRWVIKKYDIRATEKRAFSVNYTYGWLEVGEEGTSRLSLLERQDYFLYDPCFKFIGEDSVFISGLYGEKDKRRTIGYYHYYGRIADVNRLIQPTFKTFTESFWNKQKEVSKPWVFFRRSRLDDYYIRRFEVKKGRQSLFILQRMYTTDGGNISGSQLYYHFKECMIYQLTKDGEMQWHTGLASDQVLFEPFYRHGGFGMISDRNQLLMFQNEHRRTAKNRQKRSRTLSKPRQAVASVFAFSAEGKKTNVKVLTPDFSEKMTALPASMLFIDHGKYLLFFEDKKHWLPVYVYLDS